MYGPTHDHGSGPWEMLLPVAGVTLLAVGYLLLGRRARRRTGSRPADRWRAAAFLTGCLLLGIALLPPMASFAHRDFRGHMFQDLLIGMYAPLALVLSAPVSTLLRALPATLARQLTRLLRSRPLGVLSHPITALLLSSGGLAVLYFTPLYNAAAGQPVLHRLLQIHALLAGFVFAWAIAGADPAPHRPGASARLVVLGIAVAAHAVVSRLLYDGYFVEVDASVAQIRGGAEIMYYGGDIAELLLAAALVATWRPARNLARRSIRPRQLSPSSADPAL
ncbi:cytochrome c oxidase assembly protein [Streptosporangium sp. NPDC051023]|uniref:cytochrome c oxidase assembly protein n=1 Tax=Streptosporangium sp. NPDC051023 TaxID=3155410 RepID=UPI00344F4DFD